MTNNKIASRRIRSQCLAESPLRNPAEVVQWLGAVQAQDYAGAKWALAIRSTGRSTCITDAQVDQALAEGTILRTHVLRPTWHFVTPADIRWLLRLTGPRVNAVNGHMYRKYELDDSVFKKSNAALAKALGDGRHLTRAELAAHLERKGIDTSDPVRLVYLIQRAELEEILCSGARQGKQFTYALLDDRAPRNAAYVRDEALSEICLRFFTSRGPATIKDFVWWSGLTIADARQGIDLAGNRLIRETIGEIDYLAGENSIATSRTAPLAHLLPTYDEYLIAYKDRSASVEEAYAERILSGAVFTSTIVIKGQVVGVWKRALSKRSVRIELNPFRPLTQPEKKAIEICAQAYGEFLGLPVEL